MGALKLARDTPHDWVLVIYHDATLDPAARASLRATRGGRLLRFVDASAIGLVGLQRMCWRLLALCDYDTVVLTDADGTADRTRTIHDLIADLHRGAFGTASYLASRRYSPDAHVKHVCFFVLNEFGARGVRERTAAAAGGGGVAAWLRAWLAARGGPAAYGVDEHARYDLAGAVLAPPGSGVAVHVYGQDVRAVGAASFTPASAVPPPPPGAYATRSAPRIGWSYA